MDDAVLPPSTGRMHCQGGPSTDSCPVLLSKCYHLATTTYTTIATIRLLLLGDSTAADQRVI
jgi:hypothetical protein